MTAEPTLPHPRAVRQIPKSGVLTISGYGVRLRMQNGHLEIEDGVGTDRRIFRLPRVGHGLKRLVCISEDGYCTFSALNWLSSIGASFVFLDRRGRERFVTGPTAPSDSRLRRSQALALSDGVGLNICHTLIDTKLKGQEQVIREEIGDAVAADAIANLRDRLSAADTFQAIRTLEAHAAVIFFGALRDVPVMWPKADLKRIPERYRTVGSRQSPLSGGPRLAVTPFHAIENFCTALLESESRRAVAALGLLPDLGLGLHTDRPNRDSLVFDVLEPVRPQLESWLIRWVTTEPLERRCFFETNTGHVRLISSFAAKLSETAPTWGRLLAPWAEFVAGQLWLSVAGKGERMLASRLTQRHRRAMHGNDLPQVSTPRPVHLCKTCGARIESDKKICGACWEKETPANFAIGRTLAQSPEARARRADAQRQQRALNDAFDSATLPAWLTREFYLARLVPSLTNIPRAEIRKALGVSEPHAARIVRGIVPHPRHWQALAQLVGVFPHT